MNRDAKIHVAGHTGLVGSALVRRLRALGYGNLLLRSRRDLDLTDPARVREFFAEQRPEYVFLAAAKVGGILANSSSPAEFIHQNVLIETNVIHEAYRAGVKRLLFLGSSCIYPKHAPQPIQEESLLSGPLEPTNRAYAVAKIAGIEMCASYNRQHGTHFLAAMPTNLYGIGDRYDLQDSHVIPALILKMHEAKLGGAGCVTVWGTGAPRREFLCSEDAADACAYLMNLPGPQVDRLLATESGFPIVNIGSKEDLTIRELAELIAKVVGFAGELVFDPSKPDGTPRKLLDSARLTALGWKPFTPLREGLRMTYQDFLERQSIAPPAASASSSGASWHPIGK
jgi:GDP-L-fucose synthase